MDINNIAAKMQRAENLGDLFSVVADIVDYLQGFERDYDDTIRHLDSDNVEEIDFARTRYKNLKIKESATDETV